MRHILVSTVVFMFLGLIEPLSAQPEQAAIAGTPATRPAGVSLPNAATGSASYAPNSNQEPREVRPADWRVLDGAQALTIAEFEASRRSPLDIAMEAYRNAESDEDRNAAKSEIQKELDTQYDDFIDQQGKQVDGLESRLAKLNEQLQKRREAKSRMVELKLQMVISQADGLGWPDQHQRGNAFYGQTVAPLAPPLPAGGVVPGFPLQDMYPSEPGRARSPRQPSEPRAPRGGR